MQHLFRQGRLRLNFVIYFDLLSLELSQTLKVVDLVG
jgi:hypothetical protein